jgi:hypothetical protein
MGITRQRLLFLTATLGLALAGSALRAQNRTASVPAPHVSGPLPVTAESRPFLGADHDLPPMDLAKFGYVEEEFFVSGTANVYEWPAAGTLVVKTPNAPYTTRILVRRPTSSGRFSGSVIVEPLYPARRWDWPMMWGYSHEHFIEHGDAWVGVTLPAAIVGLQKFDAARYAPLSFKNPAPDVPCASGRGSPGTTPEIEDGLRWDMLSQVGALLKSSVPKRPLNGLRVQALYLTSQGGDLTTYMNAIHSRAVLANGKAVYDGYVAKAPFTAARINQCATAPPPDDPRHVIKNIGVPVIAIAAQGEVLATRGSRRADSDDSADRYRLYEVAGAGHIDGSAYAGFPALADQAAAGNLQGTAEWPFTALCEPPIPLLDTPIMRVVFDAAFENLDRWVKKGIAPPKAPRLELKDPGTPQASIVVDAQGHGIGGVRTPYIDVPAASFATNSPGPGTCREMGRRFAFDETRLQELYGTEKSYSARVSQSADRLLKDRWLTEGDARRIKAAAPGVWKP